MFPKAFVAWEASKLPELFWFPNSTVCNEHFLVPLSNRLWFPKERVLVPEQHVGTMKNHMFHELRTQQRQLGYDKSERYSYGYANYGSLW